MLYVLLGTGLLFISMAFLVTEKNAKYLLSGYNTMSEEERQKVAIQSYIPYFRKFHLFLGISFIAFGLLLHVGIGESASGIFIGVYPILAYIYFIKESSKYWKGSGNKWNKIGLYVLVGTFILIIGLFTMGFRENKILITVDRIELQGIYGETFKPASIKSVALVDQLPNISSKTNGFALGPIKKGLFRTKDGENVKLILNSLNAPFLLITKNDNSKIYFSAKESPNIELYNELKNTFPKNIEYY
jgi:hypothetical protein